VPSASRLLTVISALVLTVVVVGQFGDTPTANPEVITTHAQVKLVDDQYPWPHNGCTNAPDFVAGADFSYPCNHHDGCYARHWAERSTCDSWFRNDMLKECHKLVIDAMSGCEVQANLYYLMVRIFGGKFYDSDGELVRINTPMSTG
jgi:hypothetical protein